MAVQNLRAAALVASLIAAPLAACNYQATPDKSPGAAQSVTVDIEPKTAGLKPGASTQFASAVTGTADTSVTWAVVETGGGSVDGTGLYVAPSGAGTFHVRVSSHADPTAQATATVTVSLAPQVSVTVSPHTATVAALGQLTLSAAVANASSTSVTWSVVETGCGSVTSGGVYTAPGTGATCHVTATSAADATKSDTATVTVTPPPPVTVAVAPTNGTVNGCQTLTFTAAVTGSADTAVAWSIQEGAAGGTIAANGTYTAPSTSGTYHVVATSHASPSSSATVPVAVTDKILSVAVSPSTISLQAGASAQFTATITTTCGTVTATQVVTAQN